MLGASLIVAPGNPKRIRAIDDLAGVRVVPHQETAGSQILLRHYLERHLPEPGRSSSCGRRAPRSTPRSRWSRARLMSPSASAPSPAGTAWTSCHWVRERFDLLIWRPECIQPPLQRLLALVTSADFRAKVASLAGYDVSGLGRVYFNGS